VKKLRWGIVGLGQIAYERFLPGLLRVENAELVAVADVSQERQKLFIEQAPNAQAFDSLALLLSANVIDVLYVALPTGMHREAVEMAAAAGVHVLCEKPIAATLEDTNAMLSACKSAGVRLMTAYMSRFGDVYTEALRLIQSGEIGSIVSVEAHFAYDARASYPPESPGAWRWNDPVGGGPMLDIGIYLLFALREFLGSALEVVGTSRVNVLEPKYEQADSHAALLKTESGVPVSIIAAFTHNEVHISINGTAGKILLKDLFSQKPTGTMHATTQSGIVTMDASEKGYPIDEHYSREAAHYTQAILSNSPHLPNEADVLADMTTMHQLLS
jgi:D-xylose 1-dehydrogenase (NADP+, D-xylono-1,5-lactone-forming)